MTAPLTELLSKPLPEPMDADTYWKEAIETARSEANQPPSDEPDEEL